MPREEDIIDECEYLDFDPEFDHLFYSAGLDDCLFKESEYRSMFAQIGDQNMWNDHSSNERDISFCGGMNRAWKEGKTEIDDLNNVRNMLNKCDDKDVSKLEIVKPFYGKESLLYRALHGKLNWSHNFS